MSGPILVPVIKAPVIDVKPAPPAAPSAADLDAVDAEQKAKEATSAPAPTFVEGVKGGPTNPSLDSVKFDSLGNVKETEKLGPRGEGKPLDVMSPEDKAKVADAQEKKLQAGMASTVHVDSAGNQKGEFETVSQGENKYGAKIPDKVDYSKPVEAAPMVGPRGKGAQPDTYHGDKPASR